MLSWKRVQGASGKLQGGNSYDHGQVLRSVDDCLCSVLIFVNARVLLNLIMIIKSY